MKNKKALILSIIALMGLIIITIGVTYAFFNYIKEGTTENTVTTGTITFLYTEIDQVGAGISLTNALPISDEQGKVQTGEGQVFDFKITSTTPTNASIPYEITIRKKIVENMLDENAVKIYLTEVSGDTEKEILLDNYSNLEQTTKVTADKYIEKMLYTDKVISNVTNYEKAFRLRMWLDDSINFSPVKDEEGNDIYPYNNKTFTVTVNVYANAKVITDEESSFDNSTEIKSILANDIQLTKEIDGDYDYTTTLANEISNINLTVETENENATIEVIKNESELALNNNIKRISSNNSFPFDIQIRDNIFTVKVTSANKKVTKNYKINVHRTSLCSYALGETWTYDYTGKIENLTIPCNGIYKLEVYGAQGSASSGSLSYDHGGYGGYSYGNITVNKEENLYIVVGQKGKYDGTTSFNGGGAGGTYNGAYGGGGGGATHIAITNNRGVLSNYASYKSEILIVAGGGGGAGSSPTSIGGTGGGTTGGNGSGTSPGYGASQTSAGTSASGTTYYGKFAVGANSKYQNGAGGGGWYGGGAAASYDASGGGGGSGYLNTSALMANTTAMLNGKNAGNGKAIITLIDTIEE